MNELGKTISILKVSAAAALVGLLLAWEPGFGQSSDSLKYFPCDSGDTWFYYGEDGYTAIRVDSVFNHPRGRLAYMTNGEYLVDTAANIVYMVFPYRPSSDTLWETYRLNAQVGDCWAYDSDSYRWNGVNSVRDSLMVFGVQTRVKSFDFFHFYSDTASPPPDPTQWFSYMTRAYAYGFGMVEEGLEGGGGRVLIGAILHGDSMGIILGVKSPTKNLPCEFSLSQNYPNPFNGSTTIDYSVRTSSHVTLEIYDILGRKVETLFEGRRTTGRYTARWIPTTQASGIYICRLAAGQFTKAVKLIYIK